MQATGQLDDPNTAPILPISASQHSRPSAGRAKAQPPISARFN